MSARDQLLLTVAEAAERLRLSEPTLYRLINRGELHAVRIGRSRRISVRALEAFVTALEAPQMSDAPDGLGLTGRPGRA